MNLRNLDEPCDTPSILSNLKLKNVNRLVKGHLNIKFLAGKFDQLKLVIENKIDIQIITEIKVGSSFSGPQFMIEELSMPFRFDRNRSGGGVIVCVPDDFPSKQSNKHKVSDDIESDFIEKNLMRTKWLIFGKYRAPS